MNLIPFCLPSIGMDKELISKRLQPPALNSGDKIVSFVKSIVDGSPIPWSGTASELVQTIFTPSYEKKLANWRGIMSDIVLELYNRKQVTMEDLQTNDEFVSIAQQSATIALKTHKDEKLNRLKRAILNSWDSAIEFDIKQIFMGFIDDLSETHIIVLDYLYEFAHLIVKMKSLQKLYNALSNGSLFPNAPTVSLVDASYFRYILTDLKNKNLILLSDEFNLTIKDDVSQPTYRSVSNETENIARPFLKISPMGRQFIRFISDKPD
jgi:hypothetical protein